ncbi:uncharacterized protein [Saccopteryx bilineata]|uniref:uncharacterized protein n=1 Tax=Saccopteryx bilineata TaxID=59482 RepID=UPI00338D792E
MLTLELEEVLEEKADQVCEIRLKMEQLLEEDSQKAAAAQDSSLVVGAGVFSSSLEDEENRAGVVICSLQKMEAQLEGAPTAALVGLRFWDIGQDMLSGAEMEILTAIAMCPSLGQCKTCEDGRDEGGGWRPLFPSNNVSHAVAGFSLDVEGDGPQKALSDRVSGPAERVPTGPCPEGPRAGGCRLAMKGRFRLLIPGSEPPTALRRTRLHRRRPGRGRPASGHHAELTSCAHLCQPPAAPQAGALRDPARPPRLPKGRALPAAKGPGARLQAKRTIKSKTLKLHLDEEMRKLRLGEFKDLPKVMKHGALLSD